MDKKGFIMLPRNAFDSNFWLKEKFTKAQAWVDFIGLANWKDEETFVRGIAIQVKRGQVAQSEDSLAKRWGWSRNKTRVFLQYLENSGKIAQQKNRILSLYDVINYDQYSGKSQQTVQQMANRRYNSIYKNNRNKGKKEKETPTSKNSLTPCTKEELWKIATDLSLPLPAVQRTHDAILDYIEAGEFKHQTVYFTLRQWLRRDIASGKLDMLDPLELQALKEQDPAYLAKKYEALQRLEGML